MSEWQETDHGKVPLSWNFINASEFCTKVTDGTHDSPKQKLTGKYLVTSKHIRGRNIDFENAYLISEDDFNKINERSNVDQWDVLISMIGEYCGFSYIERNEAVDYAVKNVGIFKTANRENAFWLQYYIQSKIGKNLLDNCKSGTSQPYITLGALREYSILVPNSPIEKKVIIEILCSIDDKIDLLHRQNFTLESMAETLFRQWFVEEAKEEWDEGVLNDVISVKGGTTPSTKEAKFWDGHIPWTTPRDLSNHKSVYLFDTDRKITEEGLQQIGSGLLPIGTVLLSSRAPIGYLAIAEIPTAINQGYIAIICDKVVSNYFIYLWCKQNLDEIRNSGNGSVFHEISKSVFKEMKLIVPPKELLKQFDLIVEPIFHKIRSNQVQIRTLTTLRDTLLPKLMSGEVRVEM